MSAIDREHISEKPDTSSSSGPQNSVLHNGTEEKAQAEAKLRPERTATFKDYTVHLLYPSAFSWYADKWSAEGFHLCHKMGLPRVRRWNNCFHRCRCRMSPFSLKQVGRESLTPFRPCLC